MREACSGLLDACILCVTAFFYCIKTGTAVWCLTSGFKNAVEYHIDYAELFR